MLIETLTKHSSKENTLCISCAGGVFIMYRRNQLLSYMMLGFGIGLLIGQSLESWLLCTCGSVVFVVLGVGGMSRK